MTPAEYKSLREKLGLTQAGLAACLGVTRKTVNSRETEAVRITEEAALAIRALSSPNDQTEGPAESGPSNPVKSHE